MRSTACSRSGSCCASSSAACSAPAPPASARAADTSPRWRGWRRGCRARRRGRAQLGVRFVETSELDQRAAERDACGEIVGMICEAGAADADGLVVIAGAAALLGELRKSNRRRVRLDPASQFEQSWVVAGHACLASPSTAIVDDVTVAVDGLGRSTSVQLVVRTGPVLTAQRVTATVARSHGADVTSPASSVTVSVTVYVPRDRRYVLRYGDAASRSVPSPKSQS